jgi:hypothetical protein
MRSSKKWCLSVWWLMWTRAQISGEYNDINGWKKCKQSSKNERSSPSLSFVVLNVRLSWI